MELTRLEADLAERIRQAAASAAAQPRHEAFEEQTPGPTRGCVVQCIVFLDNHLDSSGMDSPILNSHTHTHKKKKKKKKIVFEF
jgi:hypothetical protein